MKITPLHSLLLAALAPALSLAEEGGGGHYTPGAMASLIDLPQDTPGLAVSLMYNYYEADASASTPIPLAGTLDLGVSTVSNTAVIGISYLFEPKLLGATLMSGVFVPLQDLEVKAQASLSRFGSVSRSDSASDLGDLTLIPVYLTWKRNSWSFSALLNVYAPTGGFDVGDLANTGKNYWTFDPMMGFSYFDEKSGFSATLFGGVTMNTENDDTDYQSGAGLHFDATIAQYLPVGKGFLGIGVAGFCFQQVTGDSGSGATLGDFEGRTAGVGPVLSYLLPMGKRNLMAELKWLPEIETANRLQGDFIWFKIGMNL